MARRAEAHQEVAVAVEDDARGEGTDQRQPRARSAEAMPIEPIM